MQGVFIDPFFDGPTHVSGWMVPMNQDSRHTPSDMVVSTSLKWGQDGELSSVDRDRLLELLSAVDPVANLLLDQFGRGRT
ncbi:hypothetical protein [Cyanobium sp. Morenito 9A2]|uniref:hypothetical protein n=1 Tax=Cyanobium sp. Morenito 9A2 TaxID=2823718 RepID=UPI0020CFBB71|nr:hypothetical protein [Cyanobium sp. Morenito 9A2]MCP9849356.1 hypothetical protein [Cyanobium sp. Morenito 9A2]